MDNKLNDLEIVQVNSLITAVKAQIRQVGTQDNAADIVGVAQQTVARWASRTDENVKHWIPLSAIAQLQIDGEYPHIAQALASLTGYGIYKLPDCGTGTKDWRNYAVLLARVSEVMKDVADSLADDNQISRKEIIEKELIADFDALLVAVLTLRADCIEKVENDG